MKYCDANRAKKLFFLKQKTVWERHLNKIHKPLYLQSDKYPEFQ
jgi:hypothetical protein